MLKRVLIGGAALAAAGLVARKLTENDEVEQPAHISQSADQYRSAKTRILILGAGFGGLATALELDKRLSGDEDASILVLDRSNSMLFTPLLWTVADGRTNPNAVVVPIRELQKHRRFHVLQAEVQGIDFENKQVSTSAGDRPYDILVIAMGSVTSVPPLPGLREHTLLFHYTADAIELRNHLIDAIEMAHQTEDPEERKAWLTFVVGGGGDTGIELAATIHTYLYSGLLREYPWLVSEMVRVIVVGRADRLVPMSTPQTSDAVRRVLVKQGIEVQTGVSVEGVTDRAVQTSEGEIPARTIFWAAGVAPPPIVKNLRGVEQERNGALVVDEYLRLRNHPEVYAIGDSAWVVDPETGSGVPPTAQAAEHEGRYVAQSIAARRGGGLAQPFTYRALGHMSLLGRATGVAEVKRFTITGLPAWLMWHAYYSTHIPSWRNRIRLGVDFVLAALTGRETAHLRLGRQVQQEQPQQKG